MRRGTLQHMIDVIAGAGDHDSVTRRIRLSLEHRRSRPAKSRRSRLTELFGSLTGRESAQATIRHLGLRRHRSR